MKRSRLYLFLIVWYPIFSYSPISFAEPIKLNLATQNSESSWGSVQALKPWVKEIETAAKGNIVIDIYYSQTLARGTHSWDAVKNGEVDMAWCYHGYWPELTPLTDVISLPGLPFSTAEKGSEILWGVYSKYKEIQKEFSDVKVLILYTGNPHVIFTRKNGIRVLDDLEGLRIRVSGRSSTAQIRALGGIPVNIPMPDNHIALQKGLIDGMVASWETIHNFKLYEVANHFSEVPLPADYYSLIINKHVWEGLSADNKKAIISVSELKGSRFWGANHFDSIKTEVMNRVKTMGRDTGINVLNTDERKKWINIGCQPIWEDWFKRIKKQDIKNAHKIFNEILETN